MLDDIDDSKVFEKGGNIYFFKCAEDGPHRVIGFGMNRGCSATHCISGEFRLKSFTCDNMAESQLTIAVLVVSFYHLWAYIDQ